MTLSFKNSVFLFAAAFISICAVELLVVQNAAFLQNHDVLSFAVTADIVLGLPLLYYFLIVRKKPAIPAVSVLPIFILALVLADFILPDANERYLDYAKSAIPLAEIGALGYGIMNIRKIARNFKTLRGSELDFPEKLDESLKITFGDSFAIRAVVMEISVLYYSLAGFFLRRKEYSSPAFTYHSEWAGVFIVLMLVLPVETGAIHFLAGMWSETLAWILTALSIYTAFWLIGDFHAQRLRPILIHQEKILLRTGLRWTAEIPVSDIEQVLPGKFFKSDTPDYLYTGAFGSPSAVLVLKRKATVHGLFGIRREASFIGVHVDKPRDFLQAMQGSIK